MREHIRNARLHVEAQLDDRSFDAEPAPRPARSAR
jgi:hypothetical protein